MATVEERLNILKMIQENKISAEEGLRLLEILERQPAPPPCEPPASSAGTRPPRWLRVIITDTYTHKTRVNIRMPVNVLMSGQKIGSLFSPVIQGLKLEQLTAFIKSGETGKIVDMYDDDDGERVEVILE